MGDFRSWMEATVQPWEMSYDDFLSGMPKDDFVHPSWGHNEYKLEIDAVARGNKPAHYGFYPPGQPWRQELLDYARGLGLLVVRSASRTDQVVVMNTPAGRRRAEEIISLVRQMKADESLLDDPSWHYKFSRLLGYPPSHAKGVVALSGTMEDEKKRMYRHFIQNALSDGKAIPPDVLDGARRLFPDIEEVGKWSGEDWQDD